MSTTVPGTTMPTETEPRPRVPRIWIVLAAIGDLLALTGLGFTIYWGAQRISGLISFVMFGAPFALAALLGSTFTILVLLRILMWRRPVLATALVSVGCLIALAAAPVGLMIGWSLTPNPAVSESAPLRNELSARGASYLCSNGDPGYGPDNLTPWSSTYYRMRGGDDLPSRVASSAAGRAAGLHVEPIPTGDGGDDPDTHDPDAVQLVSTKLGPEHTEIRVVFHRTPTPQDCTDGDADWGAPARPAAGEWIVRVDASADPRS